ncbi:hypothetical protein HY837_04060 [archaeon]|nr:hypothetical protein [archaeon]
MKKTIILFSALYLSSCGLFYTSKKEEPPIVSVEKIEPKLEENTEPPAGEVTPPSVDETPSPPSEEAPPAEPEKQISYQEKILFLRSYLTENQNGENNLHEYEVEGKKLYIALPVKKNIFGRNDLLFTEVVEDNKSKAYVHFPENQYPDAALAGNPGILESLLKVYERGENLEWYIYWNYQVEKPLTQEEIQKYETTISELEKLIGNK